MPRIIATGINGPTDTGGLQVGAPVVRALWRRLRDEGVDEAAIHQATGLAPGALHDPDGRFPITLRHRIWQLAVETLHSPGIGLRWARGSRPQDIGVAGYVALNSATLGQACRAMQRFGRLISEDDRFEVRTEGEIHVLTYDVLNAPPQSRRPIVENALAVTCVLMRDLAGDAAVPSEVRLGFPAPQERRPYNELFGCPISFDQPEHALLFHKSVCTLRLPTANQYLHRILTRHAERLLARMPAAPSLSWRERVQTEIVRRLHSGPVKIDELASALAVSTRTLQRRLTEEGCALSELVDRTQREMALTYLASPNVSLTEIAVLLGFSEASGFHRAFKRWHGRSPGQYRRESALRSQSGSRRSQGEGGPALVEVVGLGESNPDVTV